MATPHRQLPCDGDDICMLCKKKPADEDKLVCNTCVTPWHLSCLIIRPETLASAIQWECPDCAPAEGDGMAPAVPVPFASGGVSGASSDLISSIRAIEADESLTMQEKARKRQDLMTKDCRSPDIDEAKRKNKKKSGVLGLLDESLNCSFCMQLLERPVTTPCGHNFCLKCFQKWVGQGKRTCVKCRRTLPDKMASQPRINSALVVAIRTAKVSNLTDQPGPLKVYHFMHNQDRPDKAFTTERAKKTGKANACSGKIFVTVPPDHFGPILAENDPIRNQGVLVGEAWEDRMECRQWGAHLPHVAGIAGQADYGAQSVALSGGYEDDEDHGEWFLYTGSGGRDLSGNKRTNKLQSFDQEFKNMNESLRVSCKKGYPVRVVRSHKEKRSAYAPETGVRYDGVYRIEKCWRKVGIQGMKVCRYLFVRCDNEPAPWTSDENGDSPRPLPSIPELKAATDTTERKESPHWDYDEEDGRWKWKKPPPFSRKKQVSNGNPGDIKKMRAAIRQARRMTAKEKLLKEFSCLICRNVMTLPLTTPCAHNFCKPCLENVFVGQTFVKQRTCHGTRTLRAQKNIMKCPSCSNDISDFLQNPQVNRDVMNVIESLKSEEESKDEGESSKNTEESSEEPTVAEKSTAELIDEETNDVGKPDAEELCDDETSVIKSSNDVEDMQGKKISTSNKVENSKISEETLDAVSVHTEICADQLGSSIDAGEDPQDSGVERKSGRSNKRKKTDYTGDPMTKQNGRVTRGRKAREVADEGKQNGRLTRGRKAREVADEANDSPSSPLHVQSDDDDDFE